MPLSTRKSLSVRVRNFETARMKVNDLTGNPVEIAAIVVWQVADTAKATFAVEAYDEFIAVQAESAVRPDAPVSAGGRPSRPRRPRVAGAGRWTGSRCRRR